MLLEKMKLPGFICGILGTVIAFACNAVEPAMLFKTDEPVTLFKSNGHAVPAKRTLIEVAHLTEEQVALVKALIADSTKRSRGFVSCRYYLKTGKRIFGIVISSSGDLIGIDVTTNDVSNLPATTTHTLLVPKNKGQAKALVDEIERMAKASG